MSSKNVSLRETVYERLQAHKRPDESFSDTVERLLAESEPNWRESVGILSEEAAEELRGASHKPHEQRTPDHE